MAEEDEEAPGDRDSYYAVLNIPRDASEEEVKRAYRNLAQACYFTMSHIWHLLCQ